MTAKLDLSGKFDLIEKLLRSPNDPALKQELLIGLPAMKALAKVNPMAKFRLAQLHPQTSPQYKQMMMESAALGCTNAMLALCELLVKSKEPKKAAQYIVMIEGSNDSYILKHSKSLLEKYPELAAELKTQPKVENQQNSHRFFAAIPDRKAQEIEELRKGYSA